MANKVYYSIGEVASLCNLPVKTLRYYDEIGLLTPQIRKEETNYRYYTKEQTLTLFIIRKLKLLGFPLKEIRHIVYECDAATMENHIQERLLEISKIIEDYKDQYMEGQLLLERLTKGKHILQGYDTRPSSAPSEIEIKKEWIPKTPVLFTRRIQKNYQNLDVSIDRWFEIFDMATKYGLKVQGPVTLTYHNQQLEQFFQNNCDLEISVAVDKARDIAACKEFGGFDAITALHIGSNQTMVQTHIAAIRWLNEKGYSISGPISEEYIISPIDVSNEKDHITKVIIPITEKK